MSKHTGKITQMAVWNRDMTEDEIQTLVNGVSAKSIELLKEAERVWSDASKFSMRVPLEMLDILNRRREAVLATRKKRGR